MLFLPNIYKRIFYQYFIFRRPYLNSRRPHLGSHPAVEKHYVSGCGGNEETEENPGH